jgi:hypothetical protein
MDLNLIDLYAGMSGFALEPERFELGQGAVISQTYAHFMAPFMMAFAPALPGKPHPTPWKSARGGFGIDIFAELYLPATCKLEYIDRLNSVWWISALLRLKGTTNVFVPILSSERFASIPAIKEEPILWPIEIHTSRLFPDRSDDLPKIGAAELEWVAEVWQGASALLTNEDFSFALQAVDFSIWNSNPALALLSVWGALERLFSPSKQELSFRVSANIASFLEPPGRERYNCFKGIKTLYDHRSKAAHGDGKSGMAPYAESFAIARRALIKMIDARYVPAKKDLDSLLFGNELGVTAENPGRQ